MQEGRGQSYGLCMIRVNLYEKKFTSNTTGQALYSRIIYPWCFNRSRRTPVINHMFFRCQDIIRIIDLPALFLKEPISFLACKAHTCCVPVIAQSPCWVRLAQAIEKVFTGDDVHVANISRMIYSTLLTLLKVVICTLECIKPYSLFPAYIL